MNGGISARRKSVSAFGICASCGETVRAATLTGYGRADALDTGLRERALPRVSAGSARPGRRRRLLGLAGDDDRPRRVADASTRSAASTSRCTASCARTATRRSASSTTSASRRQARRPPQPRRPGSSSSASTRVTCAAAARASARTRWPSIWTSSSSCATDGIRVGVAPHSVRACPADALEELGRYAAEHELPLHVHADEQPREIDECLRRARPASDRAARARRAASARARRSCTPRMPTGTSSTSCATRARASACARRPRRTSATASCPSRASATASSASASARTRTCASTRSRSCASSKSIARRQTGKRGVISVDALLCFGSDEGAAALGLETWPDAVVDLDHQQLRGVDAGGRLRGSGASAAPATCCARHPTSSASARDTRTPRRRPCRPQAPS